MTMKTTVGLTTGMGRKVWNVVELEHSNRKAVVAWGKTVAYTKLRIGKMTSICDGIASHVLRMVNSLSEFVEHFRLV